jgi:hypothetical protein
MSEKGVSLKDGARWHIGQAAAKPDPMEAIAEALMGIGNALLLSIELQETANKTQENIRQCMARDLRMRTGECMFGEGCDEEDEEPKLSDRVIEANQARTLLIDIANQMACEGIWSLGELDTYLARYGFDGDQLLGYYQDGLLTREEIAPIGQVVAGFLTPEVQETLMRLAKTCGHNCSGVGNPQEERETTLPHTFAIEEEMWGSEHPPLELLPSEDPDVQ